MTSLRWFASSVQFVALGCQLWALHSRSKRLFTHIHSHTTRASQSSRLMNSHEEIES
jgi:hypothetical protein